MISYKQRYADIYTIGATDSGVLALVNSVFDARELDKLTGKVLPWLVWSYDGETGDVGGMSDLGAAWWAYIPPTANERLLLDIGQAVKAAYRADRFAVSWGKVSVGKFGPMRPDTARDNLYSMRIPIFYRALG